MSASSSVREAPPSSSFQRPSFHGQKSSWTSKTTAPSAAYLRPDDDDPHPEADAHPVTQPPRRRDQQEQRVVGRQQKRAHGRLPVDREEVAPEISLGSRGRGERLDDTQLARRRPFVEAELVPIDGVAVDRAVTLVRDPALRAGALTPLLRILDLPVLPPEIVARKHARPQLPDAVEDRGQRAPRLVGLEEADRSLGLELLREGRVLVL